MTSTTSSKNNHFGKLFKWAFVRNNSIMIVFSVLMVVGIVIDLYAITKIATNVNHNMNNAQTINTTIEQGGYISIFIAQIGAILFSLVSATHTFSFLHNKRSTDMFGAIPSTRGTLYFSHLAGGILSVVIPFTVGSLIVTVMTCRSADAVIADLCYIIFGLICIVAVYSFSVLIVYCCGTKLDSNIIILGANAIYIGVITVFWSIASSMIPGNSFEQLFNTPVITLFCPMGFGYFLDFYYFVGHITALWTTIIWSTVFTAGIILLGYFAAKNRRAETAQNEFNIKWLPTVIKVGISVLGGSFAGMTAAYSLSSDSSTIFVFSFWYILVGFVSFLILHLIFSRGFKGKFLSSVISYICTTVAVIGFVILLSTGMGIDCYVPSASNISSVAFGCYDYSDSRFTYSDPENIETVTEIHALIIDGINKEYQRPYKIGSTNINNRYFYSDYYYSDDYYSTNSKYPLTMNTYFNFVYHKKLGFTTNRSFAIGYFNMNYYDCDKIESLLKKLYSSDEYKKLINPVLWREDGLKIDGILPEKAYITHCNAEEIYGNNDSMSASYTYTPDSTDSLSTDEAFLNGLIEAIRKDVLADKNFSKNQLMNYSTTKENYSDKLFGDSYLFIDLQYPDNINNHSELFIYSPHTFEFNITNDYSNTLSYLKSNGYNV